MTLEQIICDTKLVKEGDLLTPALKAYDNPENGIKILNPAAKNVIKDCAFITSKYLPFYVFGKLANPFDEYKGKVSLECLKEFCERSKVDFTSRQLMSLMLNKAKIVDTDAYFDKSDVYQDFNQVENIQQHHNDVFLLSKAFGII